LRLARIMLRAAVEKGRLSAVFQLSPWSIPSMNGVYVELVHASISNGSGMQVISVGSFKNEFRPAVLLTLHDTKPRHTSMVVESIEKYSGVTLGPKKPVRICRVPFDDEISRTEPFAGFVKRIPLLKGGVVSGGGFQSDVLEVILFRE
jgi:hypothetical protein